MCMCVCVRDGDFSYIILQLDGDKDCFFCLFF